MKGYIQLEGKKEHSRLEWTIRRISPSSIVQIPFHPTLTRPAVKIGTKVVAGQVIGEPISKKGVYVHASTSGELKNIETIQYPENRFTKAFEIHADGKDEKLSEIGTERQGWQDLQPEELTQIFHESGLIDMDWPGQPLAPKIRTDLETESKTLVLNACDPEPYLASDYCLSMSHPLEILKGAEILRRASGAEEIIIAFLDHSMEAAELLKSKIYFLKWSHVEIQTFPAFYPKGINEILVKDILKNRKKLKSNQMTVYNAASAYAVYEAVVLQKPFYERAVTLGGECVALPKQAWARIGTSVKDLIKSCKGLLREPGKLVLGGPMRGIAVPDQETVISGGIQAILALPKEIAKEEIAEACIRCGHCLEVCPEDLSPALLTMAREQNLTELYKGLRLSDCVECGNCGYVCPSKRPMTQILRSAKTQL